MKIYIAAMYSKMAEMRIVKKVLEGRGFTVTSRWLLGADQGDADGAKMDIEDIDVSELMLVFTNPPKTMFSGGGRFVEMGYAMARNIPIRIIGPKENVFCHLHTCYPSLDEFLKYVD